MQIKSKITGLEEAMDALTASFPKDIKAQKRIISGTIRAASKETILADAKSRAKINHPGSSGALSESIGLRNAPRRFVQTSRAVGTMQMAPIRGNLKAMQMYIHHYYTSRGRTPHADMILSGIRHGHLVEFGTVHTSPKSFLWDAALAQKSAYREKFGDHLARIVQRNVKKAARTRDFGNRRQGRVI